MEWLLREIEEYCLESLLLSSLHVDFSDLSLNLWAEVSGNPTIFENAICKMSWQEICSVFSTDAIHTSHFLLFPSTASSEDIAL